MSVPLIPRTGATVLVLGEALVDEFLDGPVAGGAPLNVARSLAALGLNTCLISRINPQDAAGQRVLASLRRFGLDESGLQLDTVHATGRVSVVESGPGGGHRFVIHEDAAWDHLDADQALAAAAAVQPSLVYFGSLAQRHAASRNTLRQLLQHSSQTHPRAPRYLDLNLRPGSDDPRLAADCLALADWVKLNDEELLQLCRWYELPEPDLQAPAQVLSAAQALLERFGLLRLVITRGAAGYLALGQQGELMAHGVGLPPPALVDTVGAGDAFSAMLIAAVLRGQPWPEALALANGMAAAMCAERGPVPAHADFYEPWLARLEQP
jgi:fructokinase